MLLFLKKSAPDEFFEYSNVAATLAAYVLELAVEEPFDVFTTKHILEPLQMESSGWSFDAKDFSMHSKMYASPAKALPHYSLITYPDGGILTSAHDLSKYLGELIRAYTGNGTLLRFSLFGTP